MPPELEPVRSGRTGLAAFGLVRPVGALALVAAVLVASGFAFRELPISLVPDISYPMLRVQVEYGQVPPELLVQQVTRPLEAELAQTEGVELIESTTTQGLVQVTLSFQAAIDLDDALRDASGWIERAKSQLPADAPPPTVFKFDPSNLPVLEFTLGAPAGHDVVALRRFAEFELAPRLLGVPGVAAVRTAGGLQREVQVRLHADRLAAYGITTEEVTRAVAAWNVQEATGRVDVGGRELQTQTVAAFASAASIAMVPLQVDGRPPIIRIGDVSNVIDTHREQRMMVRVNGRDAVKLSVFKQPQTNTIAVVDGLRARFAELRRDGFVSGGLDIEITADESIYIRQAIASARNALLLAVALVIAVVAVFLRSVRLTLIVFIVVPVALAATLLVMSVLGLSINLMSMGGLIVGVGLLVDFAIVLLEAATRHVEEGAGPYQAMGRAIEEVSAPLVASAGTNVAAIIPFLALGGVALLFFEEFIVTVTVAPVAGLLAAFAIVPALYPILAAGRLRNTSGGRAVLSGQVFRSIVARAARHRLAVIAGATALSILAGALLVTRGYVFLPELDDGRIDVLIESEPGTPLADLEVVARRIEGEIRKRADVVLVDATVGGSIGRTITETPREAELLVQLVPRQERDAGVRQVIDALGDDLDPVAGPGVRVRVRKTRIRAIRTFAGAAQSGDWDVAVRLEGPDVGVLAQLANQASERLNDIAGLRDLDSTVVLNTPGLGFELDVEQARQFGVTPQQAALAVSTAIGGAVPSRLVDQGLLHDVRVLLSRSDVHDLTAIPAIPVARRGGSLVHLGQIGQLRESIGPAQVDRIQQQNVNVLTANVRGLALSDVSRAVRSTMSALPLPPGYSVSYGGRMEFGGSDTSLWTIGVLALFLVLVVLAVQYESVANPLLVVAVVPFALVGVLPALYAADLPLSSTALVGLVLLAGIAVNNSVVLVDFAEQQRRLGVPCLDAVIEAAAVRLRPICMTALAGVAGMIPLARGTEPGAEMLQPLAVVVMGGLVAATVGSLLVLPAAYVLVHGRGAERREMETCT